MSLLFLFIALLDLAIILYKLPVESVTQLITASAAAISSLAALVAIKSGQETQWKIAQRQSADHIASKRQVWIDELRKDFAKLLQLIGKAESLKRPNPLLTDDYKKLYIEFTNTTDQISELSIR